MAASRDVHRTIGEAWKSLSEQERAEYARKAAAMQASRNQLQRQTLCSKHSAAEAEDLDLTPAQVKRLNNCRLDTTLQAYAKHDVWSNGLGLADHLAALKGSLVLDVKEASKATVREWREEHRARLAYDPNIILNERHMPLFRRCCNTVHAGLCKEQPNFQKVVDLTSEFADALQARRMGAEPFLFSLETLGAAASAQGPTEVWGIVAGVCQRPLCHTVVHLHRVGEHLCFSVRDLKMHVSTMHRTIYSALSAYVRGGGMASDFSMSASRHDWPRQLALTPASKSL